MTTDGIGFIKNNKSTQQLAKNYISYGTMTMATGDKFYTSKDTFTIAANN